MAATGDLRPPNGPVVAPSGYPQIPWGEFFQDLADRIAALEAKVKALEGGP